MPELLSEEENGMDIRNSVRLPRLLGALLLCQWAGDWARCTADGLKG